MHHPLSGDLLFGNLVNLLFALSIFCTERRVSNHDRSFGEVSLLQLIQALLDREEDAQVVCRLYQLACYADGLSVLALEWMISFHPFGVRVPSLRMVVPEPNG